MLQRLFVCLGVHVLSAAPSGSISGKVSSISSIVAEEGATDEALTGAGVEEEDPDAEADAAAAAAAARLSISAFLRTSPPSSSPR